MEIRDTVNKRRQSKGTRDLRTLRKQQADRHRRIADHLESAQSLFLEDCSDEFDVGANLEQKAPAIDLAEFMGTAMRIASAARSDAGDVKNPSNRPPKTAELEEFVVALARVCIDAGGKPTYYPSNAFWKSIDAINLELPPLARITSLSGLTYRARKGKWLAKARARAKH